LAAGVAHEINNPLAAIIANAQLLLLDTDPANTDLIESTKLIEAAGIRASHVVKNLLGFARKDRLDFIPTDLNATIQDALALLRHEFNTRSVTINVDTATDLPQIIASPEHLQGVWINLLVNAIDSMEDGHGAINITTRLVDKEIKIIFEDNGKGIPINRLNHIFEPFYTTKSPGKGTGLGLSICHNTIKQHGGYIQVESQEGSGTRFIIYLPVK
jgi:two-component system NtrC family sensor kinase